MKQGTSTVGSYVYTADGERLIRQQGGKTTVYLPGGQELTLTTSSGELAAQRYYSFAGQTVATRTGTAASTVSSLFADTQGTALVSVQNITDAVTVRRTDPYGNVRGTNPSWPGDHLFLDKVRDSTGLTQVGARYYDASIGRFVSVDPVLDLKDPAQWSAYSYGEHNPVTYSDPTGMLSWASSFKSGLSKIGSAVKNGVSSAWKSTGSFVKKHQASIVGFAAGAIVTGGCLVATGGVGSVGCAALGGAAAGAASNLWRTQVQKTSRFTVGGFVRETVFGAVAGAIGGAAAKPLAAAASWAGRAVGPAAQRFGAGALSAARQAASKVSQALAQTAQNMRTQVVQQTRSAVQNVSRLLPSRSSGAASTAGRGADDLVEAAGTACRTNSFDAGTLVLMADGSHKAIEDVELGDDVIATDPKTGEQGPSKVIDLIRHGGVHTMVDVEFSNGTQVDATDEHPFWVASQATWVDAIDLRLGDVVTTAAGTSLMVESVRVSVYDLMAYNLTIADLHTYHVGVGEILVHNAGCDEWAAAFVKRTGGQSDEIKTFESPLGRHSPLGPYRPGGPGTKAVDEDWFHHTVVVRGAQVFDQWHPGGVGVDDFKQMFDYNDVIDFGF
ncbi:polymorphic toxin-type HINT domain-containing protein [Cellulomonas oligotrophica]|uniref:polymorphic toxin-type HINT domain-containing protein n=2 Tax=Cellulomonas oligotrophica TaxID=931536 RepID=UPI0014777481|nr:polymorphic toxin-type HINT domain-containing protein [Cellulomonas oligotrophica]